VKIVLKLVLRIFYFMWAILALLSALLVATQAALSKKYLKNIDLYVLASGAFIFASIFLIVAALFKGVPDIGGNFFLAVFGSVALNLIATTLQYKALKITDLSLAVPMVAFTPVFLIATSFLILGELPTWWGIAGIVAIVIGSYVLHFNVKEKGIRATIARMIHNRGVLYMLIVAFIFSISANFDKIAVQNSDPVFASAMIYLFLGISFTAIVVARGQFNIDIYKKSFLVFVFLAIVSAASTLAANTALNLQIVPYVISLKRTSIVFSVVFGAIFFKEKSMQKRFLGAIIIFIGVVIILLLSR
jgi:uncharacterized membrane protein